MGDFSACHVGFHGCNHPGDRDSRIVVSLWQSESQNRSVIFYSTLRSKKMAQILKGRLVEGPYQPICRDSAMYVSITVSTPYPLLWLCFFFHESTSGRWASSRWWSMISMITGRTEDDATLWLTWTGVDCNVWSDFPANHVGWEDVTKPQNRGQAPKEILVFEQDFSKFEETLKDEVWEAWAGRLEENGRLDWWIGGMVGGHLSLSNKMYTLKRRVLCFLICCFNILPKLGCFLEEYFFQRKGLRCFECHPFGAKLKNGCTKNVCLEFIRVRMTRGQTPTNSKILPKEVRLVDFCCLLMYIV